MTYLEKNTAYAEAVIAGQIPAGRLQRLACERFLRDVAKGKWIWCEKSAAEIVDFCGYLRHYKGEWAGQLIHLEPWEKFIRVWIEPSPIQNCAPRFTMNPAASIFGQTPSSSKMLRLYGSSDSPM